jgi:hypothetical protein
VLLALRLVVLLVEDVVDLQALAVAGVDAEGEVVVFAVVSRTHRADLAAVAAEEQIAVARPHSVLSMHCITPATYLISTELVEASDPEGEVENSAIVMKLRCQVVGADQKALAPSPTRRHREPKMRGRSPAFAFPCSDAFAGSGSGQVARIGVKRGHSTIEGALLHCRD